MSALGGAWLWSCAAMSAHITQSKGGLGMCMLSYFPRGVVPIETEILNGALNNPDGHGYAMITRDNQLSVFKSMDAEECIERFMDARERDHEGPALFHSRIATSGQVDITGCHPFRVGQDNRTVLGHNGIMFKPKNDQRSDTRIFAEDILPRMGSIDKPRNFKALKRQLGWSNKVVILTVNPARRHRAYIVNEEMGQWADSGAWHSNYDYEWSWKTSKWSSTSSKYQDDGKLNMPCEICHSYGTVDYITYVCDVCRSCNDCRMFLENCQCWYGRQSVKGEPAEHKAAVELASKAAQILELGKVIVLGGANS